MDISNDKKHFYHVGLDEQELKIGFSTGKMFVTDQIEHFCAEFDKKAP